MLYYCAILIIGGYMNKCKTYLALLLFSLYGCGSEEKEPVDVCDGKDTVVCKSIISESKCKKEREVYVNADFVRQEANSGHAVYEKLLANEHYNFCIEIASDIEFINPKIRFGLKDGDSTNKLTKESEKDYEAYKLKLAETKARRVESMIFSKEELRREESLIMDRIEPDLLYWRWVKLGDKSARRMLMKSFENGEKINYMALYYLSSYYITSEPAKAEMMLVDALLQVPTENYSEKSEEFLGLGASRVKITIPMHVQIIEGLTSLTFKSGDIPNAYFYVQLLKQSREVGVSKDITQFEYDDPNRAERIKEKAIDAHDKLMAGKLTKKDIYLN